MSHLYSVGERGSLAYLIQRPPEELPAGLLALLRSLADGVPLRPLRHPPEHVLQLDRRLHLGKMEKWRFQYRVSIPSLVRFRHVLFWEFPCPAWAVAAGAAHKPGELKLKLIRKTSMNDGMGNSVHIQS